MAMGWRRCLSCSHLDSRPRHAHVLLLAAQVLHHVDEQGTYRTDDTFECTCRVEVPLGFRLVGMVDT